MKTLIEKIKNFRNNSNDFECEEENKECMNKKEKYIEKLKNFLNN